MDQMGNKKLDSRENLSHSIGIPTEGQVGYTTSSK